MDISQIEVRNHNCIFLILGTKGRNLKAARREVEKKQVHTRLTYVGPKRLLASKKLDLVISAAPTLGLHAHNVHNGLTVATSKIKEARQTFKHRSISK